MLCKSGIGAKVDIDIVVECLVDVVPTNACDGVAVTIVITIAMRDDILVLSDSQGDGSDRGNIRMVSGTGACQS